MRRLPWIGQLHLLLSKIHDRRGEHEAALREARKAVEADPFALELRAHLSGLLILYGHADEAKKEALAHSAAFPGESWPHMQLAKLYEAEGDLPKALAAAEEARRLAPGKRSLAEHYGLLLLKNGRLAACEDLGRQALAKDASQGWAWRLLCRCAEARVDKAAALEYGKKALAAHPEEADFQRYYARMLQKADGRA